MNAAHVLSMILLFATGTAIAQEDTTDPAPREWFLEHIRNLADDGGNWLTLNDRYQSEQEPFDAYRVTWRMGTGGYSLYGEMTGLVEGEETPPFWEFRLFWHPGEGQARIMQFGRNGIFGDGPIELREDGSDVSIQTFHPPGDDPFRIRHVSRLDGDVHETTSYKEGEEGEWELNRRYTWRRQPAR